MLQHGLLIIYYFIKEKKHDEVGTDYNRRVVLHILDFGWF